jgi:TPR repeat protein
MPVRFTFHVVLLLSLMMSVTVEAAGIDDADERLFKVQQSLANQGDARAQYYLGEMYEQGLGTTQNLDEAFKWYAKAADQGDALAKRKLAHRADIEADAKVEQAADAVPAAASPEKPENSGGPVKRAKPVKAQPVTARSDKNAIDEQKIKAAQMATEKEKRRAAVRAMILERTRHPVGEPFE